MPPTSISNIFLIILKTPRQRTVFIYRDEYSKLTQTIAASRKYHCPSPKASITISYDAYFHSRFLTSSHTHWPLLQQPVRKACRYRSLFPTIYHQKRLVRHLRPPPHQTCELEHIPPPILPTTRPIIKFPHSKGAPKATATVTSQKYCISLPSGEQLGKFIFPGSTYQAVFYNAPGCPADKQKSGKLLSLPSRRLANLKPMFSRSIPSVCIQR